MPDAKPKCSRCGGGGGANAHLSGCQNGCNALRPRHGGGACTAWKGHLGDHSFSLPSGEAPPVVEWRITSWPQTDAELAEYLGTGERERRGLAPLAPPPLGVMPRFIHEERRMWDLANAVDRYAWGGDAEDGGAPYWRQNPEHFLAILDEMRDLAERAQALRAIYGHADGRGK